MEDINNDDSSIYLASSKVGFNLIVKNKASYLAIERQYEPKDNRLGKVSSIQENISQAITST